MKFRHLLLYSALLVLSLAPVYSKDSAPSLWINSQSYSQIDAILPTPPAPGSDAEKADAAEGDRIRAGKIAPEELVAAKAAAKDSVWDFSAVLGPDFNAEKLPKLAEIFKGVNADTRQAMSYAKNVFKRQRPASAAYSEHEHGEFSYPSGHSTRAYVWATLLADLYPQQRQALFDLAAKKGRYRIILGMHYPKDVAAGKIFGEFLGTQFLANPEFQKEWDRVKKAQPDAVPAAR
jgi:acid phosphatase (class A)